MKASTEEYNFYVGHPTDNLLPNKEIVKATAELLTPDHRDIDDDPLELHPLNYGTDIGSLWCRKEICNLVNSYYPAADCDPEFINFNNGASYGIMNILELATQPHAYTKQAFLVSPTYFLMNKIFSDAGFEGKMTAISEIGDGTTIDLEKLEKKLKSCEANCEAECRETDALNTQNTENFYKYVMYLIPTFSNPSGYTVECRTKLIELARKYDMLIISDDVYDFLNYSTEKTNLPPRLVHLDRKTLSKENKRGNTISNCTFSKLIAPGLRSGYQECATLKMAYFLAEGGANHSGGTPSQLTSNIIGTLIQNGDFAKILDNLESVYSKRSKTLKNSIDKYLPVGTQYKQTKGGYFSWCTLPDQYNCHKVCKIAKEKFNVVLANGDDFEVTSDKYGWGSKSVRLCISLMSEDDIEKGVQLWGEACKLSLKCESNL